MDFFIVVSLLITFILSIIILKEYKLKEKMGITVLIMIIVNSFISMIVTLIAIFILSLIRSNIINMFNVYSLESLNTEKLYVLGLGICSYLTPIYSFCFNSIKKKKDNIGKGIKMCFLFTLVFLIILEGILACYAFL